MSLVMSCGKSLTHDNYAFIIFNLFGLCVPLNTDLHPLPPTVQLAKSRLYALNDHMHLSVSAQLMIMIAVCFFSKCLHASVCVRRLVTCDCRCSVVWLHDAIHISSKHTQPFPGLQTNDRSLSCSRGCFNLL